jgi:SynChlorMet cassette protein ScmD
VKCDDRPRANPLVVLREEFDDWAILFDPDTGDAFGLSPTGVYLWKLLDGQHSIDDMLEALRRDAQDVPAEAGDHVGEFLADLAKRGLAGYEVA